MEHLKLTARPGVLWFHPANGGRRDKSEAAKLKAMGVQPGIPDLMLVADGQTYGLELKTATGRLSQDQSAMLDALAAAGVTVAVSHGLDDALVILRQWGLLKPDAFGGAKRIA